MSGVRRKSDREFASSPETRILPLRFASVNFLIGLYRGTGKPRRQCRSHALTTVLLLTYFIKYCCYRALSRIIWNFRCWDYVEWEEKRDGLWRRVPNLSWVKPPKMSSIVERNSPGLNYPLCIQDFYKVEHWTWYDLCVQCLDWLAKWESMQKLCNLYAISNTIVWATTCVAS